MPDGVECRTADDPLIGGIKMFSSRKFRSAVSFALLAGALGLLPGVAHARKNDCAQPFTDNATGPVATDCLFLLKAATGSETCDTPCICDADGSGSIVATDALLCLIESVATAPLACNCPDLHDPMYHFDPATCPYASQQSGMVATDYIGAFDQDVDPSVGNWTAGWSIELGNDTTPPNHTVWTPVGLGTLGTCPANTTDVGDFTLPAAVGGGMMDNCQLPARYAVDGGTITLDNTNIYTLGGPENQGTKIGDGDAQGKSQDGGADPAVHSMLVIPEGTLILGTETEALAITRGSKIMAVGTAAHPIVMRSLTWFNNWVGGSDGSSGRGEWGGMILSGFGEANQCNNPTTCDFILEGFLTPFYSGGTDNSDSSGTFEYVVVSNAGFDIDGNGNELNGITHYQIGSGTVEDHIQVNNNVDDCTEFFGGAVNVNHEICTYNADDNADTDLGFRGSIQFMLVKQAADAGDRGHEADSFEGNLVEDMMPSGPCFANLTILGDSDVQTEGANIGTGTEMAFNNEIMKGATERCIAFEDGTLTLRGAGETINNSYIDCPNATKGEFTGQAPDTDAQVQAWYDSGSNNRRQSVDGAVGINSYGYPSQSTF
jgi:hypothetical protein